mgnify:CR=1 FL=1
MSRTPATHWARRLFVRRADLYLPFFQEMKGRGVREAAGVARLFRRHGVAKGARILDLCCGIGRHSVPLASRGYSVTGIDLSPTFLSAARRYAASRRVPRRAQFLEGDFLNLRPVLQRCDLFVTRCHARDYRTSFTEPTDVRLDPLLSVLFVPGAPRLVSPVTLHPMCLLVPAG